MNIRFINKVVMCLIFFSLIITPALALHPKEVWVDRYSSSFSRDDSATAMTLDTNGNVYVTGDNGTIKYDASGNRLWVAQHDHLHNMNDLAVDADGNVYVTGRAGECSFGTIKYDAFGNKVWRGSYFSELCPGIGYSLALDAEGNVYVTGKVGNSETGFDYATIKYDPSGNQLWVAKYDGPNHDSNRAYALAVDTDGNVYVTGDSGTIKYDTNGNQVWVVNNRTSALELDENGNVYVTGYGDGGDNGEDYLTIKYDNDGNELWAAQYDGPFNSLDTVHALAIDTDGNVYVTGTSHGGTTFQDYATIKYDSSGNELWVSRYNGPDIDYDSATAIAVSIDGNVYVTGRSHSSVNSADYVTIKYDSLGNEILVARYDGPGNNFDVAVAIAVNGDGIVYVTGKSRGTDNRYDYTIISYNFNNAIVDPNADIDLDDDVDGRDLALLVKIYGLDEDDNNFNPACDFDPDGIIDDKDVSAWASYFGRTDYPIINPELVWKGSYEIQTLEDLILLSNYSSVRGDLTIHDSTLTNLYGLENLKSVGGIEFNIINNEYLTSLEGLGNLFEIGGLLNISNNDSLTSLEGLNITSVPMSMNISNNDALENLSGLENLNSIGLSLCINNNDALTSFYGLDNLTYIPLHLNIIGNDALSSLSGLANLTSVGGIMTISDNVGLISLSGLENLSSVSWLRISNNDSLTDLYGLQNLVSVGDLHISSNNSLTNLSGLESLTTTEYSFEVDSNAALTSMTGLENLTSVGFYLRITANNSLHNLGLPSLCSVYNNFEITSNINLCDSLAEDLVDQVLSCPKGGIGGDISIFDNKICP